MDDRENSPGGVLSRDERHWVDPYLFGGGETCQSVDFAARNGAGYTVGESFSQKLHVESHIFFFYRQR